jgi:uncharacterized membrane protein
MLFFLVQNDQSILDFVFHMLLVEVPKLTMKLCTLVEGCCKSHLLILFELLCRNVSGVHGLQFIIQSTVKVIVFFLVITVISKQHV